MANLALPRPAQNQMVLNLNAQEQDLLHVKPLSHQIFRFVNYAGVKMQQAANPDKWHGKLLTAFARGFMGVGYALNTVISTIEFIASLQFALISIFLNCVTKGRFKCLEKLTLKICAYSINTFVLSVIQYHCLKNCILSRHHSANALINHGIHVFSSIISQFAGQACFNRQQPQNNNLMVQKVLSIFIQAAPNFINDVAQGIGADFATHINRNQNNINIQNFIHANPEYERTIREISFANLRNADYRQRLAGIVTSYIANTGALNIGAPVNINLGNNQVRNGPNGVEQVYGLMNNQTEKKYQEDILQSVEDSIVQVYKDEHLAILLSDDAIPSVQNGRNNIESLICMIPIANFAQLKEIENDQIICPENFLAHDMQKYNERSPLIKKCREDLKKLTPQEKNYLSQWLLKTGDYKIEEQGLSEEKLILIQTLYKDICTLSGDLYQGNLLSQRYVNIEELNRMNFNQAYGARHLFQVAFEKALKRVNV